MKNLKEKLWPQIFIIYTRFLIGSAFVFASVVKISGERFTTESGAANAIDSAWHFFETMYASGLYWKFIGWAQLLSGFLLMTQRFSKLGALVNLPIVGNIFIITLSYYFAYTPVITGLMLIANLLLIAWEWNELKIIFNLPFKSNNPHRMEGDWFWAFLGLLLFFLIILCKLSLNRQTLPYWFLSFLLVGLLGLLIGIRREKKRRRLSLA
ncbi:MAG: hypothetical protein AAF039_16580 [Bacteroidota bacterium]